MEINKDLIVENTNHTLEEIEKETFTPYKVSEVFTITSSAGWTANYWGGNILNYTYPITFKKKYKNKPLIFATACDTTSATYWSGLKGKAGVCNCTTTGCKAIFDKLDVDLHEVMDVKGCWVSIIVLSND